MNSRNDVADLRASYDAVVVGSGHNGLVAAAYLGLAGKSVLVLERNSTLGATASNRSSRTTMLGCRGIRILSLSLPDKIVSDLGLNFQTKRRSIASFTPYTDSSGAQRGLLISNEDSARSQASMSEMTGSDEAWADYERLMDLERCIAQQVWPTLLEPLRSRESFTSGMTEPLEKEAWRSFVEEPLGRVIERYARHDVLRGLIMTDAKIGVHTHPMDPSLLQNRCFLYHVIGGGDGEWRVPVGGMRSLVDSLLDCCRRAGVDIRASAEVRGVDVGAAHHTVGFQHEGKALEVSAKHVLVNAGRRTFAKLFGQTWQPETANEGSVIKINMLLARLPKLRAAGVRPEDAFAGSFHFDEGYAEMQKSFEDSRDGKIPNPAPGETYCHSLTDPSILGSDLREKGYQTLTLFGLDMPYRLFETDHDLRKEQVKELYLEGLDRICEEPFADCLARDRDGRLCMEIKTPQDLEEELDLDQGNIFHDAPSWFFAEDPDDVGRWGVETEFPRVYRAGSSALRGGAVSGIPGHNAAKCILAGG